MNKLKRLEILKFIIGKHSEPTVTSLMKIAYLADLLALKKGHTISDYEYVRYYYGPFDKRIYSDIDELVSGGYVQADPKFSGTGDGGEYFVFKPTNKLADESPTLLDAKEQELLTSLLDDIRGYGAKTLTEAAYQTKPMKKLGATLGGNEHLHTPLDLNA